MADKSLTLGATLLGKGKTGGERVQVTLKIGQDILTLYLLLEDAGIFPDLVAQEGGAHPWYDPSRIVYTGNVPSYRVVISPIEPEPETPEVGATNAAEPLLEQPRASSLTIEVATEAAEYPPDTVATAELSSQVAETTTTEPESAVAAAPTEG